MKISRYFVNDESNSPRGFTLIEMLVVIAIIALLTGIILSNFTSARGKARDAERVSDLNQLQLSLELFFDRCKAYPSSITPGATDAECSPLSISFGTYIAQIPNDPSTNLPYDYAVDSNNGNDNYLLHAKLEYTNQAVQDGISASLEASNYSFASAAGISCDNLPNSLNYCLGPK